jgi:hypothetical protein
VIVLRTLAIEAALGFCLTNLAAGQRHGLEDSLKLECRFLIRLFGFPGVVTRVLFLGILLLLSHRVASTIQKPPGESNVAQLCKRSFGAVYNNLTAISKGYMGDQWCAVQ